MDRYCFNSSPIIFWLLFALQLCSCSGAYVQWVGCDNFTGSTAWTSTALRASLLPNGSTTQIFLQLLDTEYASNCKDSPFIHGVTLDILSLGRFQKFDLPAIGGPCALQQHATANSSFVFPPPALSIAQNLEKPFPLSSFQLEIHLLATNQTEVGCFSAQITPEIPRGVRDGLRFGPLAGLIVMFSIVYYHFLLSEKRGTTNEDGTFHLVEWDPPAMNGLGDYLRHLQFIFLTACLSLGFTGFLQPAVSSLNWFSLFSSSNMFLGGRKYTGVSDGIFETNGTYGGTYGMEHMIQILGAPMTLEVWVNMLILAILLIGIVTVLILSHHFLLDRLRPASSGGKYNIQQLVANTLRIFLSLFLQPIVAISAYQLTQIGLLPTYLISMAVLLIAVVFASYIWLFQRTPAEVLAALILNVPEAARSTSSRRLDFRTFVLAHFVLDVVRGISFGALQISAGAQIGMLLLCEVLLLISVSFLVPSLLGSTITWCSIGRFIVLSLTIVFLSPSTSFTTRSFVAYTILALEFFILIVAIFIPHFYEFANTWLVRASSEKSPGLSLRQLRRRSHHLRQLPERHPTTSREPVCVNCGSNPSIRSRNSAVLRVDNESVDAHSLRLTRPNTKEELQADRSSSITTQGYYSSTLDETSIKELESHLDDADEQDLGKLTYDTRPISTGSYTPILSNTPISSADADYASREMDLYYVHPRQPVFEKLTQSSSSRPLAKLRSIFSDNRDSR